MRPRDYALLLLINAVWAGNGVALKANVEGFAPLAAAALRFAIVLALLWPWLRWPAGHARALAGVALLQGVAHFGFLNLAFGAANNVAALSLVSQAGTPISLLLAVLFLGERIRLVRALAIAAATAGVALVGFDPALLGERLGIAFMLAACFVFALSMLLVRGLAGIHPLTIIAWVAAATAPSLALASLVFEPGALAAAPAAGRDAWGSLLYTAIAGSILGHASFSYLLQRHPVTAVAPLVVPAPVLAAVLGVLVYDLPVGWRLVAGGLIVTVAVLVITLRTATPIAAAAKVQT